MRIGLTTRHTRGASAWLLLLPGPALTHAQLPPTNPITLDVGVTATATQRANEPLTYALDAEAGQTYLLEVEQSGLDFVVTVTAGGVARSYDSPLRRDEPELVLVDVTQNQRYLFTINSEEPTDAAGAHSIRVHRASDEAHDARFVAAWRLMSDAAAAAFAGERQRAEEARNSYIAAAALWEQLGEPRRQAQALYSVGMLEYWSFENWDAAFEYASRAAQTYRSLGEPTLYANTLLLQGYARVETANRFDAAARDSVFGEALATFDEALRIHESTGNDFGRAHVLNFIGITHWNRADRALGDLAVARDYYGQSAPLFSRLGEWREELNVLQNSVVVDLAEGKIREAISLFEKILDRLPPDRDPELRAAILGNLGIAHSTFGNVDESLRAHSSAYALYESIGDATGQGYALKNLGESYFSLGDFAKAKRYLEQARPFAESANDFRTQAAIQSALGNVAFAEADYSAALERHQHSVNLSASGEERARRKLLLARDLAALERHTEAIDAASVARSESRSDTTRADALLQMAVSRIALGESASALPLLAEAADAYEALQLVARQGDVHHAYSQAARAAGDLAKAAAHGRIALDKIESLRERVAHPQLRALNSATRRGYYEHQIELLMTLHEMSGEEDSDYLREAITVDERSRAKLTIDLLAEAAVDLTRDMPPEVLAERRALYATLAQKRSQQERQSSFEDAARLSAEMDEVENRLALLETEYRRAHSELGRPASEPTLNVAEIQARIGSDSVLLQYALGTARSFLWAITSDSIRGFILPSRSAIEELARAVHTDFGRPPGARGNSRLYSNLAHLSAEILGDAVELVAAKRRVLIAADGALHYIPFAVLPVVSGSDRTPVPLIASRDDREIVNVPSMSARETAARRPVRRSASAALAIFADPVMEETDDRLAPTVHTVSHAEDAALAVRSADGPKLPRLPYTGREAHLISALVPEGDNLLAVGFDASLDTVLGGKLSGYRYVHFATHGILDSEHPALSALALSQFDAHGRRRPGYLRLYDIYGLELDADVVVLSACDTGLGKQIRGEGLVGLTQGFVYAGARNVIASLWQVPDSATADLMTQLYASMLADGQSPAAALAAAQRGLASSSRQFDPYFWGAFVIQGE